MSDIRSAILVFWDSSDYILEPFSWFDSISFASCDERVDHRGLYFSFINLFHIAAFSKTCCKVPENPQESV